MARDSSRKEERAASNSLRNGGGASHPFKLGEKVRHAQFGTGTIVNFEGDTIVTIAFPAPTGIKKLDLGFAKLEKA